MIDARSFLATVEAGPEGLAEPFGQCFDLPGAFAADEAIAYDAESPPAGLEGGGVIVYLGFGETACAVAIPATFPLPEWIGSPDDSQAARLQTLAMEWSLTLAPEGFEASTFETRYVADLTAAIVAGESTEAVALRFTPEGADESAGVAFWVNAVTIPAEAEREPAETASGTADASATPAEESQSDDKHWQEERRRRLARLQKLPVGIVVELASKKVDVASVLSLSPGSLVTFSKSCEEPVDLYVNNFRYCRGEAVKIGENFGLKVTEVGVVEKRPRRVF